jgi:hypothetical protein
MRKRTGRTDGFREGRGYSRADWDAVSDNPVITEAEFREMRPFRDVFPELAASIDQARVKVTKPKR